MMRCFYAAFWATENSIFLSTFVRFCVTQPKLAALFEAVDESVVDCFTLKLSNPPYLPISFGGHVKTGNKDFIFVEIMENIFHDDFKPRRGDFFLPSPKRHYDIFFHINRTPLQLQHFALRWIGEHKLFNVFVNSPMYDADGGNSDGSATDASAEHLFRFHIFHCTSAKIQFQTRFFASFFYRGTLAPKLNDEQKLAAINIVQARNQPLPYLLFGPAGE